MLKELYLLWMIGYCCKKKQKHSVFKKGDRILNNKTNNPLEVYETFYNCKPCGFIGDQRNEIGLNEGILNIIITTEKSNTEFSLQLTNGIVIELYHFIIIKKKLTWKIFQDLLLKMSNNKNNILSGESEKNLCKKVKSLVNTKSTLTTKKKSNDLKTFEKSYLFLSKFSFFCLLLRYYQLFLLVITLRPI